MRSVVLALSIALTGPVAGADSIAFGNRLVSVGDSVGRVFEIAGEPDRVVQLETPQGGGAGQRFEYFLRGKTVLVIMQGGRVVEIEEVRD